MSKEKNKENIQQKYLELQILIKQINELQQQILVIQQQILELRSLKENIGGLKDIKVNTETYIPLGLNIFTKAKLSENKEFLVGVGSNVLVPKTLEETIDLIEKQIEEIGKIIHELERQLSELDLRGQVVQEELVNLSKQ